MTLFGYLFYFCNLVVIVSYSIYLFLWIDAFDTEQLLECMGKLKSGHSVNVPIYDFKNHRRCSESFRKVFND